MNELLDLIMDMRKENAHWRYGQIVFNAMYQLEPNFTDTHIRNTAIDPFYSNASVEDAIEEYRIFINKKGESK